MSSSEEWNEGWRIGEVKVICSLISKGLLTVEVSAGELGISTDRLQTMFDAFAEGKVLGEDVDVY